MRDLFILSDWNQVCLTPGHSSWIQEGGDGGQHVRDLQAAHTDLSADGPEHHEFYTDTTESLLLLIDNQKASHTSSFFFVEDIKHLGQLALLVRYEGDVEGPRDQPVTPGGLHPLGVEHGGVCRAGHQLTARGLLSKMLRIFMQN